MSRVNKNHKFNILDAYHHREIGMSNRHHITQELLATAEDRLVTKEHNELSCEMPGMPRSTFLMVFSPDGTKVASTHGNHNVYVTDLRTGKNCNTLIGHPRTPWCIAFHPSSNQILATGCLGGQVRIWDLSGGSEVWTTECQTVIASLAFHPHDRLLVIATYNVLYFWDWSQPKPFMQTCTNNAKEKVRYVAFDRLGHKLITGIANMQASGSRVWERSRSSHPLFPQPSPITRIPQPDIYLVRQNTHAWYTRRGNRPPRPSAFQTPARQLNSTSSSSSTNINSNNSNSNNNNNNTSNQNETDGSISYYERRIIQLYESLMQRFLEVYRTRVISTMDRGTDPMEPIPLNSTTTETATTSTASVAISTTSTTTETTTASPTTSLVTPSSTTVTTPLKVSITSTPQQSCSKSPEAGPSGIQKIANKKRLRPKKDNRLSALQSDDEDSSSSLVSSSSSSSLGSNTGPPLMDLILEHIKRGRVNTSPDVQPSTSQTKSKRTSPKNLRKDRKRKKKKLLNFIIPDDDNDDQSEEDEDTVPRQQPKEQQSSTTVPDVNIEMYQTMETPESASDSPVSYISSIPEESGELLDFSGIGLRGITDDQHFTPNPSEPTQIDRSQWRSDNLLPPEYNIIPDQPSTSSGSTQGEHFHVYDDNDTPVDLSSNGYTIDDEESNDQQRPHVDHNYMASTSSSTNSAPTSSSSRGETRQNCRASFIRKNCVRSELRQLQFIRYMCHKFQDLLNINQNMSSTGSPSTTRSSSLHWTSANSTPSRNAEPTRSSPAQLRRRNSFPRCVTFRPGNDDIIPSTSNPNRPTSPPRVLSLRADVPSPSNSTQNPPTTSSSTSTVTNQTAENSSTESTSTSITTRHANPNLDSESSTTFPWCNRRLHHHHHRLNRHIFGVRLGLDVRRHSNLSRMKSQNNAVNLSRTDTATVPTTGDDSNQRLPITMTETLRRYSNSSSLGVRSVNRAQNLLSLTLLRRNDNNDNSATVPSNSSQLENTNNQRVLEEEIPPAHRNIACFLKRMLRKERRARNNETVPCNSSRLENENCQSNNDSSQITITSGSQESNKSSGNEISNTNNRRRIDIIDSSQSRDESSPPRKIMKTSLDDGTEPSCSTTNLVQQNISREDSQNKSPSSTACLNIERRLNPSVNKIVSLNSTPSPTTPIVKDNTNSSPERSEDSDQSIATTSLRSNFVRRHVRRDTNHDGSQMMKTSLDDGTDSSCSTAGLVQQNILHEDSQTSTDNVRLNIERRLNPSVKKIISLNSSPSPTMPTERAKEPNQSISTTSLRSNFVRRHVRRDTNQSSSQISNLAEPSCCTTNSRHTSMRSNLIRRHPHLRRHLHIPLSSFRSRLCPPSSSTTISPNPVETSGGRTSTEQGTSSSSSSSDNQTSPDSIRQFVDINENMVITPASILFIIRRLEDLIRQQHAPQPAQNAHSPPVNLLRTTNYERQIYLRLLSLRSRLTRLGIRMDSSSRWDLRSSVVHRHIGENENVGRDVENVYHGRYVLSIILIILMRYYENQHNNSPPTPPILTDRLAFMLRLSIILTDTLLLNVFERLPMDMSNTHDMPDTHEYILSTFREIDDRIDAHERRRNSQNEISQRSNYYIEDLSRMSVNDDPNETVPVASSSPNLRRSTTEATVPTAGQTSTRRWDMEPELVPLLTRMRESQTRFREFFNTRISNLRNLRRSINSNMRAYHILDDMQRSLVPRVQVNDVPVNDDAVINRPVRPMPLPQLRIPSDSVLNRDTVLNRPLRPMPLSQQRAPSGMFRPRFLHPFYGGGAGVLVDGDIDDTQREQIFSMGDDFPASPCPNHRIQIWNMADGQIPSITNPDKNVVVSDCKIHNDASVDISQDGNLLVTLLPSGGYLNITNKLGVFSIQWDNLGQCLYTASFEQNAVSVSLSTTARYLAVGLASRRVSSLVPGSERCIMAQLYKLEADGRTLLARDIEKSRNLGTTSINCIRWSPVPGQGLVYATNSGHLKVLS